MPNKGQIMSFLAITIVIVVAAQLAIQNGENSRVDKNISQVAFITQEQDTTVPEEIEEPVVFLKESTSTALSIPAPPEDIPISIGTSSVYIDDGTENSKEFILEITASSTVLDLIQEACLTVDFDIKTKEYDFGILIEAVNNIENGDDNKYWLYYINDAMPQLTPDKIQVKPNDKIELKFTSR